MGLDPFGKSVSISKTIYITIYSRGKTNYSYDQARKITLWWGFTTRGTVLKGYRFRMVLKH